jgi:hypothetical protein
MMIKKFNLFLLLLVLLPTTSKAVDWAESGSFNFIVETTVDGTSGKVFEAITGDISGWWDHSFSEKPLKLYVDPYPGGAFMEIFDEEGNGVRHAVVTAADYGRLLRYEGPLGLAGSALFMVTTWSLSDVDGGQTLVTISVHGAGEMQDGIPDILEKTWTHFLVGQLKPFLAR